MGSLQSSVCLSDGNERSTLCVSAGICVLMQLPACAVMLHSCVAMEYGAHGMWHRVLCL